jgi:hypothetical protein
VLSTFVLFLKGLLYGPVPVEPTDEEVAAYDEYEDTFGNNSFNPTPWEYYHDAVDIRERFLRNSLWILIRWRVACAKLPFTKGQRFLFPKPISRFAHPGAKLNAY